MTADAAKLYPRHRDRISGSEDYVVRYFARQNGITPAQVHQLIKRYGSNRAKLVAAAKELRTSRPPDVPKTTLASGRRAGRLSAGVNARNGLKPW
jgi:glycerol-3-phosphate dehydrogenase